MKILGWALLLFASSLGIVFAESVGNGTPKIPYSNEIALAVCLTAIIWMMKRMMTHTIPEQQKVFQNTLDAISERSEKHDEAFRKAMDRWTERCESIQGDQTKE
jgi:hypothetical protein